MTTILRKNFKSDRRSGAVGNIAGDIVLKHLEQEFGEQIEKEKGTIFSTNSKVLLRRLCASKEYLQSEDHLSNLSISQHRELKQQRRKFFYLYITVEEENIEYWLIPSLVMDKIIPQLDKKSDGVNCFVRIYNDQDRYILGGKNITKYYRSIKKPTHFADLVKKVTNRLKKSTPVYKMIDGRKWKMIPA
jgi:hypothetical protein